MSREQTIVAQSTPTELHPHGLSDGRTDRVIGL